MVFIGDVLASENEYLAGRGTFVDEEGNIRASVIGKVQKDNRKKEISVKGKLVLPQVGDIAIGIVTDVKEKLVVVDLKEVRGLDNSQRRLTKTSAIIFIANLSQAYLDNPRQVLRIGDLIKAEIIDEKGDVYFLSTKGPNYGALLSLCGNCRSKLFEKSKDLKLRDCSVMVCPKCGAIETRKVAKDYFYRGVQNENRNIRRN